MFRALVQTPSKRDRILCGFPPPDPATDGRSYLYGHGRRVRRGWLSMSGLYDDRVRFRGAQPVTFCNQLNPNYRGILGISPESLVAPGW